MGEVKPIFVVSFSGGRTSARFCAWAKKKFGDRVIFVFMDTGMEHPKTYEFIKKVNDYLDLNLVCLRVKFNPVLGEADGYEEVGINGIGFDLYPFFEMLKIYGTPYVGGAFCTDRLKDVPFTKYCQERFGKKNYITLLGIRYDEPARMVGDHPTNPKLSTYKQLLSDGYDDIEISDMWRLLVNGVRSVHDFDCGETSRALLSKRLAKRKKSKVFYMGEALDDDKQDILDYWKLQPFDLEIDEHLGNCVFCIKKSVNKIALALRDEPDLARYVIKMLESEQVRLLDSRTERFISAGGIEIKSEDHYLSCAKQASLIMYRYKNSLVSILNKTKDMSRKEILESIRSMKNKESGTCTESCEAMVCGMDRD